jgi:hypothetical protein
MLFILDLFRSLVMRRMESNCPPSSGNRGPIKPSAPLYALMPRHHGRSSPVQPLLTTLPTCASRTFRHPHPPLFPGQTLFTSRFSRGLTMASTSVPERRFASRRVAFPRKHRHRKSGCNGAVFVAFLRGWRTLRGRAPHHFVNRRSRVQVSKVAPQNSRTIPQC